MQKSILLILFFLLSKTLFSISTGSIRGTVYDENSKNALVAVNIVLIDSQTGVSSDEQGKFILENLPVGTYRIEFSYIGYADELLTDVVVRSGKPTLINVGLVQVNMELDPIIVEAGYFVEEKMIQPSVISLNREEIRRFPGGFEDVVRTVSILPGVSVNASGGRNDLLVRGGGPSENLYVVNNIEIPNINHFNTQGTGSGSLSFINLDFVENVKFSAGGFQARYGNKLSSIVSLDLSEGRTDRFGGKGLISATQFGINLEGPFSKKGSFIFSARKSYLDLIFKAAGLPFIPVYTDFNFIADYELKPGNTLSFVGLAAVDKIDRILDTVEDRVFNSTLLDNTQNQYINGINYRHISKNGYLDIILNANVFKYKLGQADTLKKEYFNSEADEIEYGAKIQRFNKLSNKGNLLLGLSGKWIQNQNITVFADTIYNRSGNRIPLTAIGVQPDRNINTWNSSFAAFLETDWQLNRFTHADLGLRFNYFSVLAEKIYIAPRAGIKFQLTPKHSLKFNYGHYFQAPSPVWLINQENKKLKAMQNRMGIISWDYLVRKDIRFTAETYYKKYVDLPTGTIPGVNDHVVMTNTGTSYGGREDEFQSFGYFDMVSGAKGEAYGIEFLLQKKFSEIPLYGKTSLSFGKSELSAGNKKVYPAGFDQRVIFNLSCGYKFNPKWEVSGKFRYFSGIPITPMYKPSENPITPGSIQNIPQEYLSDRLNGGHHLDLRVDRFFNLKNYTIITFIACSWHR